MKIWSEDSKSGKVPVHVGGSLLPDPLCSESLWPWLVLCNVTNTQLHPPAIYTEFTSSKLIYDTHEPISRSQRSRENCQWKQRYPSSTVAIHPLIRWQSKLSTSDTNTLSRRAAYVKPPPGKSSMFDSEIEQSRGRRHGNANVDHGGPWTTTMGFYAACGGLVGRRDHGTPKALTVS